jgi:hypothetical protein
MGGHRSLRNGNGTRDAFHRIPNARGGTRELGNSQEIIYPQRCGRSLTEPPPADRSSPISRETFVRRFRRSSETLAERG